MCLALVTTLEWELFAMMRGNSRDAHLLFCFFCGTMKSILTKSTGGEAYWRGIGLAAGWHGSRFVLDDSQTGVFWERHLCSLSPVWKERTKKTVFVLLICVISVADIVSINNVQDGKLCSKKALWILNTVSLLGTERFSFLHCNM